MSILENWIAPRVQILHGDVRGVLPTLPAESFHCAVTSPPYFGLRDYGCEGQIGLETTLDAYLAEMVAVCREVRRVLRSDGTFWLNIGDSYSKEKQLMLIPVRVAMELQRDGWLLRSKIIWRKTNPIPDAAKDKPSNCYEEIFLFSKQKTYFYDLEANAERCIRAGKAPGGNKSVDSMRADSKRNMQKPVAAFKNMKNVWDIATHSLPETHFATFPPELAERCVKAGCPVGGYVLDPFGGAGTTGLVASRLKRNATLVELNATYIDMARRRIARG